MADTSTRRRCATEGCSGRAPLRSAFCATCHRARTTAALFGPRPAAASVAATLYPFMPPAPPVRR